MPSIIIERRFYVNYLQKKKWAIVRACNFKGYLCHASGYPLTLTDCMAEYPVSLSVVGNTIQDGTPSPDNPVEIQGVGDKAEDGYKIPVIFSGNNLSPTKSLPAGNYYITGAYVEAGKTYTINAVFSGNAYVGLWVMKDNGTGAAYTGNRLEVLFTGKALPKTFTPSYSGYLALSTKSASDNIMLVEGSYTSETMPPYEQTFPIYTDSPLYGSGDISDVLELDISNKKATLTQQYYQYSFNGAEKSITNGSNSNGTVYGLGIPFLRIALNSQCNKCSIVVGSVISPSATLKTFSGVTGGGYNYMYFYVPTTMCANITEFKAWLSEQATAGTPLTVVYQLVTPVVTDISDKIDWDSIPKLWRGTVIIKADTTIEPSAITAEYYADKPEEVSE